MSLLFLPTDLHNKIEIGAKSYLLKGFTNTDSMSNAIKQGKNDILPLQNSKYWGINNSELIELETV